MATMTARDRPAEAKRDYDAYLEGCPSALVFDRISNKWAGLTLSALTDGPRRYSELAREIAGASQKMLTQTLRNLERDGLVSRTVTASVPPRVDYALTPLGGSLRGVLARIKEWAEDHVPDIERARAEYDASM
ncbi:winged helix-turn-helix transcriptional regulator [Microbacterium karelineae]|uniref:winged helix-turn-helix transcriptional regulator n=1 Tax=Microbacterium karelineae TaxID=2654283 RepID=UPI0012EAE1F7|nr:helix-turn-helix domain-containing protein [Microbacterium karelineae]